jgi:hypothetical protein
MLNKLSALYNLQIDIYPIIADNSFYENTLCLIKDHFFKLNNIAMS